MPASFITHVPGPENVYFLITVMAIGVLFIILGNAIKKHKPQNKEFPYVFISRTKCLYCCKLIGICPAASKRPAINSGIECNGIEDNTKYNTGLNASGTGILNKE
ncbi:MAG: hypothetical protein PHE15_03540 [Dehalococcoidales bacterium]|nr:hypothetical protein [Dehalococcoidales bacterium]